jgi:hypothetical protein
MTESPPSTTEDTGGEVRVDGEAGTADVGPTAAPPEAADEHAAPAVTAARKSATTRRREDTTRSLPDAAAEGKPARPEW